MPEWHPAGKRGPRNSARIKRYRPVLANLFLNIYAMDSWLERRVPVPWEFEPVTQMMRLAPIARRSIKARRFAMPLLRGLESLGLAFCIPAKTKDSGIAGTANRRGARNGAIRRSRSGDTSSAPRSAENRKRAAFSTTFSPCNRPGGPQGEGAAGSWTGGYHKRVGSDLGRERLAAWI